MTDKAFWLTLTSSERKFHYRDKETHNMNVTDSYAANSQRFYDYYAVLFKHEIQNFFFCYFITTRLKPGRKRNENIYE